MLHKILPVTVVLCIIFYAFTIQKNTDQERLDMLAEKYVKLVLTVGQYDPFYVDAYYGPPEWKPDSSKEKQKYDFPSVKLLSEAEELITELEKVDDTTFPDIRKRRLRFLKKHLLAVKGRIGFLSGKKFKFDDESRVFYDAVAPAVSEADLLRTINKLDKSLPGKGTISERYETFKNAFIIPQDKVDTLYQTALAECRKRTLKHIVLPVNERFTIEYVANEPWGAYNWYKGNATSIIQFNTDIVSTVSGVLAVTSHEGYPGHHTHNARLEMKLYKERGWVEYSVYPLYSPLSLIAEGVAEYGIHLLFTDEELINYESSVLFPLAGLDTANVRTYHHIARLRSALEGAMVEVARRYLDGQFSKEEAIEWLSRYGLRSPLRAKKNLDFIGRYRSYVINYSVGESLIRRYIEKHASPEDNREKKWQLFTEIISTPVVPSDLEVIE